MDFLNNPLFIALAIAIPIVLIQGTWVFYDARRRKEKYYWLWGIFALLNAPGNLLIYLLVTRVILNKKNKGSS
ncbi:sigmaY antisigma factor component [Clostridium bowmanii]|uniref:sigmaY antisigma factor component n=1 Tax=Clostridium bowmanii TaxID=132925 RepID=UPI001C0E6E25|nr:sigmaY antisigma factor component [Clostridium bowmanii]MBU3191650.1 sigmaY antisigma factor component [Clostridium bowmanii]MCA1073196.1 sigmaY antisigma factor component [Clostridium bowmanii]